MTSNWAYFRKHWIKPEVYPLIGAMAAALGVCGAALINKATDPSVTWNKSKRKASMEDQLEGVDEIVPLWSSSKHASSRIFGNDTSVKDHKLAFNAVIEPITVKVGEEEEEEEEQPQEEEVAAVEDATESEPVEEVPAQAVEPALEVVDEAAETINAAVDAAIQSAAAITPEPAEAAASSVHEVAAKVESADKSNASSADS